MNAAETGDLLAFMALYDNRKVGRADVVAWMQVLGDLPFEDCKQAVAAHYGDSTDRIMPAHIRHRVKAMRASRIEREILPAPDHALADSPRDYQAALLAQIRSIASGFSIHRPIARRARKGPPPDQVTQARDGMSKPLTKQEIAAQQAAEYRARRGQDGQENAA